MAKKDEGWLLDPVVVKWLDARTAGPGWEDIATMQPLGPMACTTAGFLMSEDDEAVVLCQTVSEEAAQGRIVIPRGCVVEVLRPLQRRKRKRKDKKGGGR